MPAVADRREPLLFLLVFGLGAYLRLTGLAAESLWTDEIAAILVARVDSLLQVIVSIAVADVNPPLFYVLLHFWLRLGDAEAVVRLLPALAGLGMIVLTWRLGRRLGGPRIGLLATLLVALSPLAVYLSHEVRYHTLAGCLALGTLLAAGRYFETPSRLHRNVLAVTLALGFYTHYYLLLLPLVLFVWRRRLSRDRPALPGLRGPLLRTGLLFLPWIAMIAYQFHAGTYRFRPSQNILETLFDLTGYLTVGQADARLYLDPGGWRRVLFLPLLAPFWALLIAGLRRREAWARSAAAGFFWPVGIVLIASLFLPVYGHRYFLPFLPLWFIVLAAGADSLQSWRKPLGALALLAACLMMVGSNWAQRTDPRYQREDWRGLVDYLQEAGDSNVVLAINDYQSGPWRYYAEKMSWRDPPIRSLSGANRRDFFRLDPPATVAARLAEIRRGGFERYWALAHFEQMYDPRGEVRALLDRELLADPNYDLEAMFRVPVRVYWRDRETARRAVGSHFAPRVDFGADDFDRLQLGGAWTHVQEPWAWLGDRATVDLHAVAGAATVRLRVQYPPTFHDGRPVRLQLAWNGTPLAEFSIQSAAPETLEAPLPQKLAPDSFGELTLTAAPTFDPAVKIGGADHTPKSVLVDWVEVQ
ncbi:MAG: hypothetical protein GX444_15165 [Myxococcales bacterium]|nr:hypothetical protein [Myxococcales bacterium]